MIDELRENLQVATVRSTAGAQSAHSEPRTAEATRTRMRKAEDRKAAELRERGWVCFRADDPDPVDLRALDGNLVMIDEASGIVEISCARCYGLIGVVGDSISRLVGALFAHLGVCGRRRSA